MSVIVDYGMGNLRSVQKAMERIAHPAEISDRPDEVRKADRLIVPGVGAFGDAMAALKAERLDEAILEFVETGRPMLGICLGLQVLLEESEEVAEAPVDVAAAKEAPLPEGLALVPGRVVRFGQDVLDAGLKVPHMGWNRVEPTAASPLFEGLSGDGLYFYFAHSYYAAPADGTVVAGRTEYGPQTFASAVASGNVMATQFHPEKSQAAGLKLLENFVERT